MPPKPSALVISKAPTSEKQPQNKIQTNRSVAPSISPKASPQPPKSSKTKSPNDIIDGSPIEPDLTPQQQSIEVKSSSHSSNDEIQALKKRITELNTLNQTYVYQISALENQHKKELEECKNELISQRRANKEMEKKVSRVDEVENAIVKLYLEMKDRSTEVTQDNYDTVKILEEQKQMQELKNQNPLIVLDKLKANLRNLIAFKEDYENELKDQIHRKMTDAEVKLKELKQKLRNLEAEKEEYKINAARAIQERNEALEAKREIIDESNIRMRRLQKDNDRLVDEIKKGEQIISDINQKLDTRDKILRHREIQLMRITQLESQIQKTKLKNQFDQNKVKSEMFKSKESYERQLSHFNKIKAEKKDLEDALQKMSAKVQSLMRDANRTRVIELEQSEQQLERTMTTLKEENEELLQENKKLKVNIENLKNESKHIKEEYEKIFLAAVTEKKKKKTEEQNAIKQDILLNARENAQQSPHITEYYKKRLKEKEKEVEELTKRVRRMILSEHRGSIMEKNFELERTRLQNEVKTIKKLYVPKDSSLQFKHQYSKQSAAELKLRNQELEEKLRDYENLKAANIAQTQAYNRLQHRQQSMLNQMLDFSGQQHSDNEDSLSMISDVDAPLSPRVFNTPQPNSPRSVSSPQGRPRTALVSANNNQRRNSISGSITSGGKRPQSASSSRTRPLSASGSKIKLGSTHSSVRVGSLL